MIRTHRQLEGQTEVRCPFDETPQGRPGARGEPSLNASLPTTTVADELGRAALLTHGLNDGPSCTHLPDFACWLLGTLQQCANFATAAVLELSRANGRAASAMDHDDF